MNDILFLIAGLGNPGREYLYNRHNIGFMVVDRLAVRLNISFNRLQFKALLSVGEYGGNRIILVKPQTFMNGSGQSVASLVRFYKLNLANLLLIHDHLDLPFGALRMRPGGGSGGHQGMNSVIERLGTQDFPRLRFGIGRPPGQMDPADFVLQDIPQKEMFFLSSAIDNAADAVQAWMKEGLEAAMTHFNIRDQSND